MKLNKGRNSVLVLLGISLITNASCNGNVRHSIGINNQSPDAFKVISAPPLTVPPDFSLRPPVDGAKPLQSFNASSQAKKAIFSANKEKEIKASNGEKSFLKKANADAINSNITTEIDNEYQEQNRKEKKKTWFGRLFDWINPSKDDSNEVINAIQEKQRIETTQAAGQTVTGKDAKVLKKTNGGGLLNPLIGK